MGPPGSLSKGLPTTTKEAALSGASPASVPTHLAGGGCRGRGAIGANAPPATPHLRPPFQAQRRDEYETAAAMDAVDGMLDHRRHSRESREPSGYEVCRGIVWVASELSEGWRLICCVVI